MEASSGGYSAEIFEGGYSAEMLAGRATCLVCGEDEEGQAEGGDHREEEHPPAASGRADGEHAHVPQSPHMPPRAHVPQSPLGGGVLPESVPAAKQQQARDRAREEDRSRQDHSRESGRRAEGGGGGAAHIHFSSRRGSRGSGGHREDPGGYREEPARRSSGGWVGESVHKAGVGSSGAWGEGRLEENVHKAGMGESVHKAGVGLFFAEYDGRAGCVVDEIVPGSAADRVCPYIDT